MVIPVLLLVGCTDQQNQAVERQAVEQEPWGTVVERNLVCTDFMQRVGAVYEFRDDEDKPKTPSNVTNNALFVGSTSELSKMIKEGILNNKEE